MIRNRRTARQEELICKLQELVDEAAAYAGALLLTSWEKENGLLVGDNALRMVQIRKITSSIHETLDQLDKLQRKL